MSNERITQELPHDFTAEKAVLGSLLIDNRSFDEISDLGLRSDDFYHPQYGLIFAAMNDLHIGSQPVSYTHLTLPTSDLV